MSAIGRIFLVLNLILSALFLGWASSMLSTSDNYRTQLDDEKAAHAVTTSETTAFADDLKVQLTTAQSGAATARNERDDAVLLAEGYKADLETEQTRGNGLLSDITVIGNNLSDLNATLASVEAAKDRAVADARDAVAARDAAVAEKMAAMAERTDVSDALDAANTNIAGLEEVLAKANANNLHLETILATAVEMYQIPISEIVAQPLIAGTVLSVKQSGDISLVALNVGSEDKVEKGMTFEVWSGGQYKGQVRVESVMPGMCSALVTKAVSGTAIAEGDHADTRL